MMHPSPIKGVFFDGFDLRGARGMALFFLATDFDDNMRASAEHPNALRTEGGSDCGGGRVRLFGPSPRWRTLRSLRGGGTLPIWPLNAVRLGQASQLLDRPDLFQIGRA